MNPKSVITTVKGQEIRVRDVVDYLKISGNFRLAIYEVIKKHVIEINAKKYGIKISKGELSKFLDDKRALLGLSDVQKFQKYLRENGVSLENWKAFFENDLKQEKLKQKVINEEMVKKHFSKHKKEYNKIVLGRIVCKEKQKIKEAFALLEEGASFAEMAYQYSIDGNTKYSGGFIGEVKKSFLDENVGDAAFNSKKDDVIGPFFENGFSTLYKVYQVKKANLDEALEEKIKQELFKKWLHDELINVAA